MKRDPLSRLLKSAARHAREEPLGIELDFPTQARILAAWRASRDEPAPDALLPLLRRAVAAAFVVTALALAFTVFSVGDAEPPEADEITAVTKSLEDAIELAWTQ